MGGHNGLSHYVATDQPLSYTHQIKKPRYIDTLEEPYAKFIFHYRGQDFIEQHFGVNVTPNAMEERTRLEKLPKAEILDRLLVAQGLLKAEDRPNRTAKKVHPGMLARKLP
ncbi:hypothetical protein KEM52_006558 [Ascosphaera acerosa]|nr:hypothetical protein KEM52_006558 [Ascosphaera acerosa]